MARLLLSAALIGLLALPAQAVRAQTATATVSSVSPGKTIRAFGYGLHNFIPSQLMWLRHAETNGARVWLEANAYQPEMAGEHVNTQTQFITRRLDARRELNDGPLGDGSAVNCSATLSSSTPSQYIDWGFHFADWEAYDFPEIFDELNRNGVEPVLQRELRVRFTPLAGLFEDLTPGTAADQQYWHDAWNLWRHMFAITYMAGSRWGYATWQLYNEPHHETEANISKTALLERWRIAADAIQLAIKTVNKRLTRCGKPTLTARIIGPTAAPGWVGGKPADRWEIGDPDPLHYDPPAPMSYEPAYRWCNPWHEGLDDKDCYGRYLLNNRTQTRFYNYTLANADSFPTIFQAYSLHRYASKVREQVNDTWSYLQAFPGSPPVMDVYVTETNATTIGAWPEDETAETPAKFAALGKILIEAASATTTTGPEPAKNIYVAQFIGSDKKGGYNRGSGGEVGGVTNIGEVVRLCARALKGARPRYPITMSGASQSSLKGVASLDASKNMLYVLIANTSASDVATTIDLRSFNSVGLFGEVETVSSERRGNAALILTSPTFSHSIPAQSVVLFSVSTVAVSGVAVRPSEDATVKGGSNGSVNYGSSDSLYAAGDTNYAQGRNAAFLRFLIPETVDVSKVKLALLTVYGQAKTTGGVIGTEAIAHVYGIENDSWWESSIKGSSAPNLAYGNGAEDTFSSGTTTRIANNFLVNEEATATTPRSYREFLGHLTGRATAQTIGTDVTQWIKTQSDRKASFLVTREVRFDPVKATNFAEDTLTEQKRSLWMASSEATSSTQQPQLILIY